MIVVDSSVWVGYFKRQDIPQVHALRALDRGSILVGDVVLLEILQGASTEAQAGRLERELRELTIARMFGPQIAVDAARNYRTLRRLGITLRKTADNIIATYCINNGHQLLHNDRDFGPFEAHLGLQVYRAY
ncbi:MAG: VapC toxin family domain ribonuclease [Devosia sp.]|uniref:type II toxin-antitoxin system VapC family toxin n=1 Tax=Devosia sp. TaxID=1871048 RepID=UPI00260F366B|nr:PIN domain nuclease [Devosia sp.]MDB5542000.1 VapC toxin family domain ribonuclease [Devosia sp.]